VHTENWRVRHPPADHEHQHCQKCMHRNRCGCRVGTPLQPSSHWWTLSDMYLLGRRAPTACCVHPRHAKSSGSHGALFCRSRQEVIITEDDPSFKGRCAVPTMQQIRYTKLCTFQLLESPAVDHVHVTLPAAVKPFQPLASPLNCLVPCFIPTHISDAESGLF
jgi:hypothetical protein